MRNKICPLCENMGVVETGIFTATGAPIMKKCQCLKDVAVMKFLVSLCFPGEMIKHILAPAAGSDKALLYSIENREERIAVLSGSVGTRKTTHAAKIACRHLRFGRSVVWKKAGDIFHLYKISRGGFTDHTKAWEEFYNEALHSYLFIDDLGATQDRLTDSECLRLLLESDAGIVITTNHALNERVNGTECLANMYSQRVTDFFDSRECRFFGAPYYSGESRR